MSRINPFRFGFSRTILGLPQKLLLALFLLLLPFLWLSILITFDYQKRSHEWRQAVQILYYRGALHHLITALWLEAQDEGSLHEVQQAFRELSKWELSTLAPQLNDISSTNSFLSPLREEWQNLHNKSLFYTEEQKKQAYRDLIKPLLDQMNLLEPLFLIDRGNLSESVFILRESDPLNFLRLNEGTELSNQLLMKGDFVAPHKVLWIQQQAMEINDAAQKRVKFVETNSLHFRLIESLHFYAHTLDAFGKKLQSTPKADQATIFFQSWPSLLPPWRHAEQLLVEWIESKMNDNLSHWREIGWTTLGLTLLTLSIVIFLFYQLWQRLKKMVVQLEELVKGNANIRLSEESADELGYLGQLMNQMIEEKQQVQQQSQALVNHLTHSTKAFVETVALQRGNLLQQEQIAKQVGLAAEEIGAKTRELILSTSHLSQVIQEASSLAINERQELTDLELIIGKLLEASKGIANLLQHLNQETIEVSTVTTSLVTLTDQSYLLALNTSLEASRSTDVSNGFAVIAQEIHRLADQASVVTLEIERRFKSMTETFVNNSQQIEGFSGDISAGEAHSVRVRERLSQLLDKVQFIGGTFERLQSGFQQQVTDAEAIGKMAQTLTQVTQQALKLLHQWQETIQEFSTNLQQLQK